MARHLLLLTIALTFSIAMPLILVFSLAYFGCGHLYTKVHKQTIFFIYFSLTLLAVQFVVLSYTHSTWQRTHV